MQSVTPAGMETTTELAIRKRERPDRQAERFKIVDEIANAQLDFDWKALNSEPLSSNYKESQSFKDFNSRLDPIVLRVAEFKLKNNTVNYIAEFNNKVKSILRALNPSKKTTSEDKLKFLFLGLLVTNARKGVTFKNIENHFFVKDRYIQITSFFNTFKNRAENSDFFKFFMEQIKNKNFEDLKYIYKQENAVIKKLAGISQSFSHESVKQDDSDKTESDDEITKQEKLKKIKRSNSTPNFQVPKQQYEGLRDYQ